MQGAVYGYPQAINLFIVIIMKVIQDLLERGNVTVAVTANDLKVFALDLVEMAKQELKQQITDANTETYLSPDQVCKMLDVDRTTLWRWDKKGYLCPVEVGGKRRYPMSKINIMLKGGK